MPCYLFTFHGYGMWMPDHQRGFVRRKVGIVAPDTHLATCYRKNLNQSVMIFERTHQQILIEAATEAFEHQNSRGHGIATESTHLHLLVSWTSDRTWETVRRTLRGSLTRRLNFEFGVRDWFSKQPSRKRVAERQHFDYLMQVYSPKHRGLKWCERAGIHL
mgnify:FL=1